MSETVQPNNLAWSSVTSMSPRRSSVVVAGRVMLALVFVLSGLSKLGAVGNTQGYMHAMGVPSLFFWPTIALELGAGLLVVVGWQTRAAAGALAAFCLVAALVFHHDFQSQLQAAMFLKNISMAGGLLLLVAFGAGPFSIDSRK